MQTLPISCAGNIHRDGLAVCIRSVVIKPCFDVRTGTGDSVTAGMMMSSAAQMMHDPSACL